VLAPFNHDRSKNDFAHLDVRRASVVGADKKGIAYRNECRITHTVAGKDVSSTSACEIASEER